MSECDKPGPSWGARLAGAGLAAALALGFAQVAPRDLLGRKQAVVQEAPAPPSSDVAVAITAPVTETDASPPVRDAEPTTTAAPLATPQAAPVPPSPPPLAAAETPPKPKKAPPRVGLTQALHLAPARRAVALALPERSAPARIVAACGGASLVWTCAGGRCAKISACADMQELPRETAGVTQFVWRPRRQF
jgi:hypothetical protein